MFPVPIPLYEYLLEEVEEYELSVAPFQSWSQDLAPTGAKTSMGIWWNKIPIKFWWRHQLLNQEYQIKQIASAIQDLCCMIQLPDYKDSEDPLQAQKWFQGKLIMIHSNMRDIENA